MVLKEYFEANGYDAFFPDGRRIRVILDNRNVIKKVRVIKPLLFKEGDTFTVNTSKYQVVKELVGHPPAEIGTYQIKLVFI